MRPATTSGHPAFGCALSGRRATVAISASTWAMRTGPVEQLAPITSAPASSNVRTTSIGLLPARVRPSSSKLICATTGRSQLSRAARSAISISRRSLNVSRISRSTPPSSSASICSRK